MKEADVVFKYGLARNTTMQPLENFMELLGGGGGMGMLILHRNNVFQCSFSFASSMEAYMLAMELPDACASTKLKMTFPFHMCIPLVVVSPPSLFTAHVSVVVISCLVGN